MSDRKQEEPDGKGSNQEGSGRNGSETSVWEWVVAGVSTLLVLGAVGFLLYDALSAPSTPPRITLQVDTVVHTPSGYLVEFRARNTGQSTAAGLTVEGELKSDTGTVEKSNVTIDYVPSGASRKGGLFFSKNPREYTLEIRPLGYDRP